MKRRSLLQAMATVPAAGMAWGAAVAAPRRQRETTLGDAEVFQVRVNRRGNWVIVRLRTQNGLTGIGDASHGGNDGATVTHIKQLADLLRGRSIFDVEWFRAAAAKLVHETNGAARSAASALEQCLWDLIGKVVEQPVYRLFGGALHDRIPLYANINRSADPRTPDGFAVMARRAVAAGFNAVKLAPFDEMPRVPVEGADTEAGIREGIARAQSVRDAIGPKRDLLIDAHSRFTLKQGLELLPRMEPLNLYWLEEVTPEANLADLAAINRAASMPSAGGEMIFGIEAFYRYVQSGAVDIIMPDVKLCGGMLELKKISAIAEAAGLTVSPHGPASPIGNLAAAHVMAGVPNFSLLEFAFGEVPWRADIIDPAEDVLDGHLNLSERPGLGIELNERTLRRYAV